MSKDESKKWLGVVGRMLLAYALIFVQSAWAGQNQATRDKPGSPHKAAAQQTASAPAPAKAPAEAEESESAAAEKKGPDDATHQGIKVHGHWTIEIRNPDGTLATHRELENSLHSTNMLSLLLSGQAVAGPWSVFVGALPSSSAQNPCPPSSFATGTGYTAACIITQKSSLIYQEGSGAVPSIPPSSAVFGTLSVSLMNNQQQIQLTGNATAQSSGLIEQVSSYQEFCQGNVTANGCNFSAVSNVPIFSSGFDILFTQAPVSPSLSVVAGQTIAVTVTISFS